LFFVRSRLVVERALSTPDFWLLILLLALGCWATVAIWRRRNG